MRQNNNPLISIITVSYNSVNTIEQTILSVLSQTYSNIEYIIIDGGSTDGTLNVLKKYESKLSFVVSEPDDGIYDAMNKGISHSSGDLIGIINSDDWYETDAVENIVNRYLKLENSNNTIIYGMIRLWKNNKEYALRRFHHNFLHETVIQHPTCFVPKCVYEKYGTFKKEFRIAGDFDLLNRFKKEDVCFSNIDIPLTNFRIGGASTTQAYKGAVEYLEIKLKYGYISSQEFKKAFLKLRICKIYSEFKKYFMF